MLTQHGRNNTTQLNSITRPKSKKIPIAFTVLLGLLIVISSLVTSSSAQNTSSAVGSGGVAEEFGISAEGVALVSLPTCPPPLIANEFNLTSSTCSGPCCVPCPAAFVFYEPHKLENIYTVTSIVRAVSAAGCGFILIVYLILPSRRKHPHAIVTCFAFFMIPWQGMGTAWLRWKDDLLCKSPYEIATMSNSWFCGVQGVAVMYFALVILCLALLLIGNLHMLVVYRSLILSNNMTRLMILSFIIPLGPVIPVGVNKQIENPGFGSVCFVSPAVADYYFFYPLSVLACFGGLMHIGTIAYIIKVIINTNSALAGDSTLQSHGDTQGNTVTSNKRRRQTARGITQFLEKQWRSGAMAICLISVDMIYWLFYFIDAKKMTNVSPSTPWFVSWVTCLVENAATNLLLAGDIQGAGEVAQAACASVSRPHVPSFTWAAVSDLFPALLGIMTVVIFGSKLEMWRELRHELFGRFSREDKTIFVMDDIRKEDQSHQPTQYPSQEKLQQQAQDHVDKELFNSGEITLNSNNAHDILTYNYTSWAKGDSIITSPTKATSFSTAATYGGATRKASFKIVDDREPILYHNPDLEAAALSQQKSEQQQKEYALNVTEGSVPWPSWPTTTYTSPRQESPISNGRRPNLTVKTRDDLRSFQTSSPLASPPSQTSPASTEFYDAEDFIGSPTSAYGSLRSGYNANILNRSNSHSPVVNEAFNKNRVYDRTGAPISSTSTSSSSPTLANAHGSPLGAYSPRPAIPQKNNLRRG